MAKHPTSSRVHRDPDDPQDAFLAGVEGAVAWARAHSRALIIGGVLVLAAVLLVAYYVNARQRIEQRAVAEFSQVQQSVAGGNAQLAIRDLNAFIDRYGGSSTADQARLILADLLLAEDRADEAVETLGDLPDDLDDPLGSAAARLLAAAHEALGNADRAVDTYRRVADRARFDFQRQEALADAARVRLQNGNAQAAADLYEELLETLDPNEPRRGYYEMWLAEARAQAREGDGTTPTTPATPAATDTAAAGAPADTAGA